MLKLPLLIVREQGWAFRFDPRPQRDAVPFYQFSLREIMIYTLLVAVLAGLWSATRPSPSEDHTWPLGLVADAPFLVVIVSAFLVPMSIWAAFFWSRPIHGALVAMLVLSYWAVTCMRLVGVDSFALLYATVQPAVLTIHILALQLAGFRFVEGEPPPTTPVDAGPDP